MGVNQNGIEGGRQFPSTSWSAIRRAQDPAAPEYRRHIGDLIERYWRPVYSVIRFGFGRSHADAKDLTQQFFAEVVIDRRLVDWAAPGGGSFRTLLRTAINRFMANDVRDAVRLKRGGGMRILALEEATALESETSPWADAPAASPDELFDQAWNRAVLELALDRLSRVLLESGEASVLEVFRQHDLSESDPPPTYADIGAAVGLTVPQVKHALRRARSELKAQAVELLRATTDRPADLAEELRAIFA